MVQHKMKQKVTLPKGAKRKVRKIKALGPKKGQNLLIAPKRVHAVQQAKINAEITRVINEKNEEMIKEKADRDVGRMKKKPAKS